MSFESVPELTTLRCIKLDEDLTLTVINTNVGALMARAYAASSAQKTDTSMERLSSGMRINGAADDAAGLAVANKMQSQLIGIKTAIRNSQDGVSLVQTAESGMGEISNMILRMRELAVQMANGIYTSKDRDNAQLEVNALLQEIDKIASNTKFNGVALLGGNYDQTIRAGNTNLETIRVSIHSLSTLASAKITEFVNEHAVAHEGATVGTGGSEDYTDPTSATAYDLAFLAGHSNLSDDGADGVDADGSDTDIVVRNGQSISINTDVFSKAFETIYKADGLGTFTLEPVLASTHINGIEANVFPKYDTQAEIEAYFDINSKTGTVSLAATNEALGASRLDWYDGSQDLDGDSKIDEVDRELAARLNFFSFKVVYTARDGVTNHEETINLSVTEDTATTLNQVNVETAASAIRAVESLDKAAEEISSAQAKLGAIQNRLQHNIDNLSKGAMLTEQSVGRIVDAEFATETAKLSKHQILNQAATAMLAQANQSKQSILSLLQ